MIIPPFDLSSTLSTLAFALLAPTLPFLLTRLFTTLAFYLHLRRHGTATTSHRCSAPTLPYTIPLLGTSLSLLTPHPTSFLTTLSHILRSHALPIITLQTLGQKLHILSTPSAVQSLFRARNVSREKFNRDVVVKAMGVPIEDARLIYDVLPDGSKGCTREEAEMWEEMSAGINRDFLLKSEAVGLMTGKFLEVFIEEIKKDEIESEGKEVRLVEWLKEKMFVASTTALFGRKLLVGKPELEQVYWGFDEGTLARYFGVPRWWDRRAYDCQRELLDVFEKWVERVRGEYGKDGPEVEKEWSEEMGSRAVRARHVMYGKQGVSNRARAGFDCGFLFGLTSNAIPAACWMLCHLLSPENKQLLRMVRDELKTVKMADGSLDLTTLFGLPVLNSVFHETLRLYTDVLVSRVLHSDLNIGNCSLKSGELVIAPSWLAHRDATAWPEADGKSCDMWYGERFLKQDEKSGKSVFSTADTAGTFFPFGGGAQICPGRVFAKQEVFAAVAAFLLEFDVDFIRFLPGANGSSAGEGGHSSGFPKIARQFIGNTVMAIDSDLLIKLRMKKS